MLPDRVSNPGPLTYESGALPIALRGPALMIALTYQIHYGQSMEQNKYYEKIKIQINQKIP